MTFWPGFLYKDIIDGVVVSCKKNSGGTITRNLDFVYPMFHGKMD